MEVRDDGACVVNLVSYGDQDSLGRSQFETIEVGLLTFAVVAIGLFIGVHHVAASDHDLGDSFPKTSGDFGRRDVAIFDHIVQQARYGLFLVTVGLQHQARNADQVADIWRIGALTGVFGVFFSGISHRLDITVTESDQRFG